MEETEITQNNPVFVWKTSNCRFTWKRIANLLGVFPEVVLCNIDFHGFFDVAFDPHISLIFCFMVDRVAKLVLFV